MKSDVIHVTSAGKGIREALEQTEAVAAFRGLAGKNALHLRLLAEEMTGMMYSLADVQEADFWIDAEGNAFKLHLKTNANVNADMRKSLLSASTSGTNAAAKGVMGKLRDLFERAAEPIGDMPAGIYANGWMYDCVDPDNLAMLSAATWSFNRYRSEVEKEKASEEWDELEKSIVANLADEVEIGIRGGTVEMIIYKKFEK